MAEAKGIAVGLRGVASFWGDLRRAASAWLGSVRRSNRAAPSDVVVLEESEAGLRLARVERPRGGAPRVRVAFRAVAPDLDAASRDLEERRAVAAMVAELGAAGRPAIAALTGPDVVVRRLSMPAMHARDLRSALELECRRHVNYPLSDAELRYEVVPSAPSRRDVSLLVALAPKRRVEARRALLASAGLRPWSITVPAVGLRADLERGGALPGGEVVAYLDIGSDSSQIVVLKGRDIRFSRDLSFGRQTMVAALRQIVVPGVGIIERSSDEAEELLLSSGIPIGAEEANFVDGVPLAAVGIMLRPTLERLVRELWNSFDYCNEQFLGEAVTRVVLRGPGAGLPNLTSYLRGVLKMPVEAADPTSVVSPANDSVAGSGHASPRGESTTSVSLASVPRDTLNFLAGSGSAPDLGWIVEAVPAPAVAAAAAVLIVSIAVPSEVQTIQARQRVSALRGDLEKLAAQSGVVAAFRAAREDEVRLKDLEARLTGSRIVWSSLLRDLSHRVGRDVRLTAVEVIDSAPANATAPPAGTAPASIEPRSLRISGLLRTANEPAEGVLAGLMRSLGASPEFDQVKLGGCERLAPDLSSFTLTVRLAEGSDYR
ncbi:MAG TPA: pilus assembly protein PilM [Candidatus Eisenbacteria bacterium]|nr:pilus assembly protein PilM [Candidatus Eisenbacteria bacterium]